MGVQFILGASGTGKTTYIYEKMIQESMLENHKPLIFVLPEQSNMLAEQEMVKRHPNGGTMEISIVSFTRLAYKVFDEKNIHTRDVLDDYGKNMLIMKILKKYKDDLKYYKNMIGKPGFIEELKSILSEFYQYQITQDVLTSVLHQISPNKSLYHKLLDLQFILQKFQEEMSDTYMVTEQILSLLKESIAESDLLRDAKIYFDGFTGFTPVQYAVIKELMKNENELYFSLMMDEEDFGSNDDKGDLFSLSKNTLNQLCNIASDCKVTVLPHIGLKTNYRLKDNETLQYLERELFRYPVHPYQKEEKNICIVEAMNIYEETQFIARRIQKFVQEEGYAYNDFAIITGDLAHSGNIWKRSMETARVPYFLDYSEQLSHNPMVEMIGMISDLFRSDFAYDAVFSFLKTGFLDLEETDIYELENYVLKYGVKGYSRWNHAFKGRVKGLHKINEIRFKFMSQIEDLTLVFKKEEEKSDLYLRTLYNFMSTNNMAERLYQKSKWLEKNEYLREANAYAQVYDKFIAVLDKTMDILGEEIIKRDIFFEVLIAGVRDLELGMIPSTLDQVVIGDIERTRLKDVKVLFISGVNEGMIPSSSNSGGILIDQDREKFKNLNITLAPDSKETIYLQQFYFYTQMIKAKEKLIFSYQKEDEKGGELRPSYFVNRIKSLFPNIKTWKAMDFIQEQLPMSEHEMIADFSTLLANEEFSDSSMYNWMHLNNEELLEKILDGYFYNNLPCTLDKKIVQMLYGKHATLSVSKLESYVGCAYQFFLRYGLHLKKREEYKVESSNIGTILHSVMEIFFKKVKLGEILIYQISQEEMKSIVEELTKEFAKKENDTIFESSFRKQHQLDVMIRIAQRSIFNLCKHLKEGKMEPTYFEKEFSAQDKLEYIKLALNDGISMDLKGIIDRVDLKVNEDAVYVKVIDYKSGNKDIDYKKMYQGKQLQLTVYMSVMMEVLKREYPDKKIISTGMFYYHMQDPIIQGVDTEELEKNRNNNAKLKGLVNQDETCLDLLDGKTGKVAPVFYKKNGEISAKSKSIVNDDELEAISEFVHHKMEKIGNLIMDGNIDMNPENENDNTVCNYCDFKNICRFEPGVGNNQYRIEEKMDSAELKNRITIKNEEEDA